MAFWSIILIDNQGLNQGKSIGNHCPNGMDTISNRIAGNRTGDQKDVEFVVLWQENTDRGDLFIGPKIVV